MKACFQIVGEKESKDSIKNRTKAICVHKTPCRIRIYLIRVVLVQ